MLLLNVLLHHELATSDKGRLTRYELNAYPYEIIIGLQRYGFSYNWQTFSSFFLNCTWLIYNKKKLSSGDNHTTPEDNSKAPCLCPQMPMDRGFRKSRQRTPDFSYRTMSSGNTGGIVTRFHVS